MEISIAVFINERGVKTEVQQEGGASIMYQVPILVKYLLVMTFNVRKRETIIA